MFEAPERFVVGTVGQPGEREFFLQASARGEVVTVGLEKTEVAALAEGLSVLLAEVRKGRRTPPPVAAYLDRAPLEVPVEEDFRLGALTVSWDGTKVTVEAAGQPSDAGASEPVAEPDAAHEASEVLQVALDLPQTYAFVARAQSVVSAGRKPCVLCGRPDDLSGHLCPRLN